MKGNELFKYNKLKEQVLTVLTMAIVLIFR